MIPTIEQVIKFYQVIALTERMKTGRPGTETVANAVRGLKHVCSAAGIGLAEPITVLTRQRFDLALASFTDKGLTRLSAWSYICQMRAVFARWCLPYYYDAGWQIPRLEMPSFRAKAPRYQRPGAETLASVKAWYKTLTGEYWFAATMMLEFAMRNGDVLRLTKDNFVERQLDDPSVTTDPAKEATTPRKRILHYLSYTPHKTELSSGRRVFWPIHPDIWAKYEEYGGIDCLDVTDETFVELNTQLRSLGFHGHKGAYELRKICIDHVYQKFGAEMAVSLSGDDIKTISRYYADPAQPNFGAMRIIDML